VSNKEKYSQVFIETFNLEKDYISADLEYNSIPAWDSVGHMSMVAQLEETFDVMLEMDEIIDFSSFNKGIEILGKHGIDVR
jgi:acyl carrier protein